MRILTAEVKCGFYAAGIKKVTFAIAHQLSIRLSAWQGASSRRSRLCKCEYICVCKHFAVPAQVHILYAMRLDARPSTNLCITGRLDTTKGRSVHSSLFRHPCMHSICLRVHIRLCCTHTNIYSRCTHVYYIKFSIHASIVVIFYMR